MQRAEVPRERLDAVGDALCFRDPRGRSRRPSILAAGRGYVLRGPCRLLQEYRVAKEAGVRFTGVTRDPNPIHIDDEIVPGALTVSKTLLPLEILLPDYRVRSVRAKFTGASFYDRRTVSHYALAPGGPDGAFAAEVKTMQAGRTVCKIDVSAVPRRLGHQRRDCHDVDPSVLALIRQYLECLQVDSAVFLASGQVEFPLGFLASLPSGEMVRKLKGEGGMLNVLSLSFEEDSAPAGATVPAVELSQGKMRPTFNRILTRITDGFRTFGQGFALVHGRASLST